MSVLAQRAQRLALAPSDAARPTTMARPAAAAIRLATVSEIAGLEALRPEWSALFESCGAAQQVFQTFEWLALWASLYVDRGTRLSIVTGRVDGRLVLVWPLVIERKAGLRILVTMGEPLSQYSDALIARDLDDARQDATFDYVMALPMDVVALRRVRADAAIAPLLARRLGAARNPQTAPFIDFAGAPSVEAFEKRFSSKRRTSRRRLRRGLEERGPVVFEQHGPSAEMASLVTTALGFKRDWAKETGVFAPALRDPRFERFFVAAALAGDRAPNLRLCALRCGDEIVGIEISAVCRGVLYGHVLAPRPGFGELAVGKVLVEKTILSALEQGFAGIDLMAPADSYKLEWTDKSTGVGDYYASRSIVGGLYTRLWLGGGRERAKTLARQLRPLVAKVSRRGKP